MQVTDIFVGTHRFIVVPRNADTARLADTVENRWIPGPDGTEDMPFDQAVALYHEHTDR